MPTLRLGLRVVIGPRQKSNVPGMPRLARHAHQVLAQPVRVRFPAQPRRRTRSRSLLSQHLLHYFSVESQEANGPLELLRKLRPRTRENRGKREGPEARSCTPSLYSMSSLLAHALKQQVSLPVARLLVLVNTASQLF